MAGIGSELPLGLGFLAYNWYNQWLFYTAIKTHQLHALSVLPVYLNTLYALTYLGGVTCANVYVGVTLGIGTSALMIFNNVASWKSWATNMTEGYNVYEFFFYGWRRLTPGWHKFFLLWQIGDSMFALVSIMAVIALVGYVADRDEDDEIPPLWAVYPLGSLLMLLIIGWPLILWMELIIARNHIESETDMVAVWLFVAQIGTIFFPFIDFAKDAITSCFRKPVPTEVVPMNTV